jgi:hypothetical protein
VKRLVVLLIVLVIVLIVVAAEMKRNPEGSPEAQLNRLTPAERVQLEEAEREFSKEQARLLHLREERAPAAELDAQQKKAEEAARKVMALGGKEELRLLGDRGRAGRYGGGRGGRGGRRSGGRRAGRSGSAEGGRRPGGLTGEAAPAGSGAGTSHSP